MCSTWTQVQGIVTHYIDNSREIFTGIGNGVTFGSGGKIWIGNVPGYKWQFEGELTHMNMWDYVLQESLIQRLATMGGEEAGNVLHWSFFAAMAYGEVQYSPYSSISPKGMIKIVMSGVNFQPSHCLNL